MLFQKPSLRTRVTFEAGMVQLGGHAIYLTHDVVLGARESVRDVARNLERFVDGIVVRTGPHEVIEELAAHADVPVINGLSLREHPCQALADVFTIQETVGPLPGRVVAFVGDGNNVYHSLALARRRARDGDPARPPARLRAERADRGPRPGARRRVRRAAGLRRRTRPRSSAARRSSTRTRGRRWARRPRPRSAATPSPRYRVDEALLDAAGPDAVVMHCLPAHRGEEITSAVMDGPRSLIFDQSENRLHVQKALLVELLAGEDAP